MNLTYDDIQLVPSYSEVSSRKNIDLKTKLTRNYEILIPIIGSPMPTVCGFEMANELMKLGGVGCVHRFMSVEEQCKIVEKLSNSWKKETYNYPYKEVSKMPIMAAVGANGDFLHRALELILSGANIILIDVAHGHHKNVKDAIKAIKYADSKIDVIAGNIATKEAAYDLQDWGADALRVGVGGGSLCTTRVKTGFGVPNVTCLQEIISISKIPVIADGGIRSSGDIAKALALGSSSVMLGSLIAGTNESPGQIIPTSNGLYKKYSGAASMDTKITYGQEERNVEGESTMIPYKGNVKNVIDSLLDGVKSALSYGGANNLQEFNPKWVQVTNAGMNEAKPHLL